MGLPPIIPTYCGVVKYSQYSTWRDRGNTYLEPLCNNIYKNIPNFTSLSLKLYSSNGAGPEGGETN